MTTLLSLLSVLGLLFVCHRMIRQAPESTARPRKLWLLALFCALLQGIALVLAGSVDFFSSLAWVSALMAALAASTLMRAGERFLPLLSYLVAILCSVIFLSRAGMVKTLDGWQIHLHVSVALMAYASLSLAALQALLLLLIEKRLKSPARLNSNWIARFANWLPPLSRIERQLFQLIMVGFVLLTLTLLSGGLFIHDWFAQHLVHKTILTIAAWLCFGLLLLGHWRFGWRGRQAAIFTLGGMTLLLLAFFGSKMVLELILKR